MLAKCLLSGDICRIILLYLNTVTCWQSAC